MEKEQNVINTVRIFHNDYKEITKILTIYYTVYIRSQKQGIWIIEKYFFAGNAALSTMRKADLEFLMFGSSVVQSPQMLILWTGIHPIEKNG